MNMNRRNFLKASLASSALYAAGGLPALSSIARASGFAPLGHRVLVNVMLSGGPDFRHLMPPAFDADPNSYGYRYWEAKAASHNINQDAAAYQERWENDYYAVGDSQTSFGILKSCYWLKNMWDQGNVAVINNTIGARSRDHAHCQLVLNQGNLTSGPNDFNRSGWGGRLADAAGGNVLSLTQTPNRFCYGPDYQDPESHNNANLIAVKNSREFNFFQPPENEPLLSSRPVIARSLRSYYATKSGMLDSDSPYKQSIELERSIRDFGGLIDERLDSVPLPYYVKELARPGGTLSNYRFGAQTRNLYDVLAANDILSLRVASMEYGNWDSHKDQRNLIEPKLTDMFGYNKAFDVLYKALPADIKDNLVLVFAGEFGRQLHANGANGCDHGKGNSILVVGNPVNGGIYGDMFPQEELSRINIPSADINGLTEIDHVLGEVADWMVPGAGDSVFPNRTSAALEPNINLENLFA